MTVTLTITTANHGHPVNGGHRPIQVSNNLKRLRDMVLALAKEAWLAERPNRSRIARNALPEFHFSWTSDGGEKAAALLECNMVENRPQAARLEVSAQDYVENGCRLLIKIMTHLEAPIKFAHAGNEKTVRQGLERFAQILSNEEALEFSVFNSHLDQEQPICATWSRQSHEIFSRMYKRPEDGDSVLGDVRIGSENWAIAEFNAAVRDRTLPVLRSHNEHDSKPNVAVLSFNNAFDRMDYPLEQNPLHELGKDRARKAPEPMPHEFTDTIKSYATLKTGWDAGHGRPISQHLIAQVLNYLAKARPLPNFHVVAPTAEGGIHFEFVYEKWDFSLIFQENGRVDAFGIDLESDAECDFEVASGSPSDVSAAVVKLMSQAKISRS